MRRYYNELVKIYYELNKNKIVILGALFVMSMLRSVIWYAMWGIDILSYSSLQDIFMSFASYTMGLTLPLIMIVILGFFCPNSKKKWKRVITYSILGITFLLFLWLFASVFRLIFSFISLIYMISFICLTIVTMSNKFKPLVILMILIFPIIQPIEQYVRITEGLYSPSNNLIQTVDTTLPNKLKQKPYRGPSTFKEKEAFYDNFSFTYNNVFINTNDSRYYTIGNSTQYYFIIDCQEKQTLIIPKSECINIKSKPFESYDLLFFGRK